MKKLSPFKGFTLIELLVVIVIIAILAGISLPVFSRIMERGKAIGEASNLRQIGIAMLAAVNDNDGFLPASDEGGGSSAAAWPIALRERDSNLPLDLFFSPLEELRMPPSSVDAGGNFLVSFAMNNNCATNPNTERWRRPSSLVFIGAAFNFSGDLASSSATMTQPPATPAEGSYSKGGRIGVLFADYHVEQISWGDFVDTTENAKFTWSQD